MLLSISIGACVLLVISRVLHYRAALKTVQYIPGLRPLFSPIGLFGFILPVSKWNPGATWPWEWRKTNYFGFTHDVISVVSYFTGDPTYWTCSIDVAKQLLASDTKSHLVKPADMNAALMLWGDNLVAANDEMWKRHRRIINPAFTVKTYEMVVRETIALYKDMNVSQGWQNKQDVYVPTIQHLTQRLALVVILRCGFGLSVPWEEASSSEMSIGQAMTIVCKTAIARLVLPRWAYWLPLKSVRDMDYAWTTLATKMPEAIEARKRELNDASIEQQGDVFTQLVAAFDGHRKQGLDQQEVIGNMFTFMFVGHETTASVLAATLGFLAIHQDLQDEAYREVRNTIAPGIDPTLKQVGQMHFLHCCFLEALRLYPPGSLVVRDMTEDVAIRVQHPQPKTIVLAKGTRMVVDMISLHHNPHDFPEPDRYTPSRWEGASEQAATMFGYGPRACIGRKLAHTEAVCFLALILRDWKLDIVLEDGETREEYEARVMGHGVFAGLGFGVAPLGFKMTRRLSVSDIFM